MESLVIDRFEGIYAVCERDDSTMINIERSRLPKGIRAGNIIIIHDDGVVTIDVEGEINRKKQIFRMQNAIFKDE